MQLNNPNGRICQIDKIDVNQNRVVYSIYEFGNKVVKLEQSAKIFENINLKDYLNQSINFMELCYNQLTQEVLTDYEISEDTKNWAILIGSTGNQTTVRIYMPASVLLSVTNTETALWQLIQAMAPLSDFAQRNGFGSMQYLEELDPAHRLILEQYSEIIIENK